MIWPTKPLQNRRFERSMFTLRKTSVGRGCFSFREDSLWNGLQNELKGAPKLKKLKGRADKIVKGINWVLLDEP